MSISLQELEKSIVIDSAGALDRLMNKEALLKRFLKKFTIDPAFSQLEEGISANDYKQVEFSAHAIKGASLTLGLNEISRKASDLVAAAREGNYDALPGLFADFKEKYTYTINEINKYVD